MDKVFSSADGTSKFLNYEGNKGTRRKSFRVRNLAEHGVCESLYSDNAPA
jgi:hypothetical protein